MASYLWPTLDQNTGHPEGQMCCGYARSAAIGDRPHACPRYLESFHTGLNRCNFNVGSSKGPCHYLLLRERLAADLGVLEGDCHIPWTQKFHAQTIKTYSMVIQCVAVSQNSPLILSVDSLATVFCYYYEECPSMCSFLGYFIVTVVAELLLPVGGTHL